MASIRKRSDTGTLLIDFTFRGHRCREQTALPDTPANRKRLQVLADTVQAEIAKGTFDYRRHFPHSRSAARFGDTDASATITANKPEPQTSPPSASRTGGPTFASFVDDWFAENEVRWRRTYRETVADIIRKYLKPAFGDKMVADITKADILQFRASLTREEVRKRKKELSGSRINYIMTILRQVTAEAADRYEFNPPFRNIKPVKNKRTDVEPFTLDEVNLIIAKVRADFRDYYKVRFFTGMRTGEIDGLKWKYVDFDRRLILVRETVVRGQEDYTKTDASQRDIQMNEVVYQAMRSQAAVTQGKSEYVFANASGQPLEHNNVTKRVWYPLLRYLGLKRRRPYQTRHTTATLWLASGENPQWIARQLGHSSTEMLFKVYARFVPNLTRQDGSAFERLLARTVIDAGTRDETSTEDAHG